LNKTSGKNTGAHQWAKGLLLWLIGIPIPIIHLLWISAFFTREPSLMPATPAAGDPRGTCGARFTGMPPRR
jgi:hypothetical protein